MKNLLFLAVVAGSPASPVQKVIQLVSELKTKVEQDLANESAAMEKYSEFCDDEQSEKGFAIKTAAREIEGYNAVIEDTTGKIQQLSSVLESSAQQSAKKGAEAQSATDVRNSENTDFKAAEKELVEAVDTLARAVVIVKRELSFAQGSAAGASSNRKMEALSSAISTVIDSAFIDTSSKKKLKSFLSASADNELSLHQPQATTHVYENHSGGIIETLEEMKDKAEASLNSLRRDEMKAKHAYQMIKQSLDDAVTVLEKEIREANASKSSAAERLAKAQGDLATTQAAKAADEAYVSKLTSDCRSKAQEFDERQKSAQAEIAALVKGHEILSAKFSGFAQISVHRQTINNESFDARDKAQALLKKLGRTYNSFAMMQIANAAAKDPFAKVRGLIESMISKLLQQAQEEATHDSFCKEETAKSTKAREEKTSSSDKYQARIDEANAAIAELKNEVSTLSTEISDIDNSNKNAAALRADEKKEFDVASKDYRESAEAVTQALVVLKDFYRGASLIQQAPEFGSTRGDAGHSIIEILETAESDFTRLLAEAETSESEAIASYKSLTQANKVARSTKEASVKAKTSEIKSTEVALTHHSEDLDTVSKELDAVHEYLSKLKSQCESRAQTYEERKAKREAELAGLKEALAILQGDDVAVLLQKKSTGFLKA
jgi:DNA repair exonuclease SbcCD ATPase subunit